MMVALYIIICIITFIVYKWQKESNRINKLTANIPRIKSFPIVGCAPTLNVHPNELLNVLDSLKNELGPIFLGRIGPETVVCLSSVKHCEDLLASYNITKKGFFHQLAVPWLGSGLVTAPEDIWQKNKKLLTPAFQNSVVKNFVNIFNANFSILNDVLNDKVGEPGFDASHYVGLCTLDIFFETSLGVEINALKSEFTNSESSPVVHLLEEFLSALMYRICRPWLYPEVLYRLSPAGRRDLKNLESWKSIIKKVISSKREKRLKEHNLGNDTEEAELTGKGRKAFLDLLLDYTDSGVNWTDYDLQSEVSTMITGGHDTVTSAISFALYVLKDRQDIQEKILNELNEIFGDSDRDATFNDLQNMNYLDKVIKEVLRMYPSVPFNTRCMTEELKLKTGHILPEGVTVVVIIKHMHYDPEVYPEPEVFDPERFSPENSQGRSIHAYSPFGSGPRSCIGKRYAMLLLKCGLSAIIRKHKILPAVGFPDISLYSDMTLRSKTGVYIKVEKR